MYWIRRIRAVEGTISVGVRSVTILRTQRIRAKAVFDACPTHRARLEYSARTP